MQVIILFVIMALAISTFSVLTKPGEEMPLMEASLIGTQEVSEEEEIPQEEERVQVWSYKAKPITKPVIKEEKKEEPIVPQVSIDTYIRYGPRKGEVIDETNKITFEFRAILSPKDTEGRILFETKVEGLEGWKETYSAKRTVTFPSGPKEYTFLVRAKIKDKDIIDPTPAKKTFKINISPYFDKVKISSISSQSSSRPSLINLSTYLEKEEEINITDWSIKGRKGSFVISFGIEKYYSDYTPVPTDNIVIKRGDRVYLSGTLSPLGKGMNFRPNKCLGYFTNNRDFPVSVSKNCPRPEREEISYLGPCCQEFILNLGKCKIPDYSSDLRISRDSDCVAYLNENLNYNGCYRKYSQDEDFVGKDWHIYTNFDILVTDKCDTLYLLDQNGLFVDKYSYGREVCK